MRTESFVCSSDSFYSFDNVPDNTKCIYMYIYLCISVGNKLRVYQTVLSFTEFLFSSVLFLCHVLFTLKDTKFSAVHMCA